MIWYALSSSPVGPWTHGLRSASFRTYFFGCGRVVAISLLHPVAHAPGSPLFLIRDRQLAVPLLSLFASGLQRFQRTLREHQPPLLQHGVAVELGGRQNLHTFDVAGRLEDQLVQ